GEALRQILVNRYYGNVKPGQRRDSLTTFSNGPLTSGAQGKSPTGDQRAKFCLEWDVLLIQWLAQPEMALMGAVISPLLA
ncbi:inositol 1,4,5-trisphosphate receptor type 1-like isoform X1, partial [Lates japonicus]